MTQPLLPTFDKLEPYIRRIDASRWYSNFGTLNEDYCDRLAGMFEAPCVTGSSATSLITATLMALALPKGSLIAMPSYTFPATAAAVVSAGHTPFFLDVCPDSIVDVSAVNVLCKAIIVVAPYGKYPGEWNEFSTTYNIPVIIDAAAAFDVYSTIFKPKDIPVIISTHATKAFGTGEGGFVTCHDKPLLEKIRRITNFGFSPDRQIEHTGLNAKFSEYHAAIGLASLDEWPEKRLKLLEAVRPYNLDYAVTQVPVRVSKYPNAKMGVYGCHRYKAYEKYPRTVLSITEDLIDNIGTIMVGID